MLDVCEGLKLYRFWLPTLMTAFVALTRQVRKPLACTIVTIRTFEIISFTLIYYHNTYIL
jgi:hypothetical protein